MKMPILGVYKKTLPLCIVLILSACVASTVKQSNLTTAEAKQTKADLKLEMIAPPTSAKVANNAFSSIEVEPFDVQGEGLGFADLINDKIIASITKTGYATVLTKGADTKLSGTLRVSQIEKQSETTSFIKDQLTGEAATIDDGEEPTENSSQLGGLSTNAVSSVATNFGNAVIGGVLGNGLLSQSLGGDKILESKGTSKRLTAIIAFKLTNQDRQVVATDTVQYALNDKQSSYLLSSGANQTSDPKMLNRMLELLADKVAAAVSPHPQFFLFNWMDSGCSDASFDTALKYAKQGLNSEAEDKWKNLGETATESKCRAAILYNRGLLKLSIDPKSKINQKEAYNLFTEADAIQPGEQKFIMPAVTKLKKIAFTHFTPADPATRAMRSDGLSYHLKVYADPEDSRILLVDSDEEYKPEMWLKPGIHSIRASAPGYKSQTKQVKVKDHDVMVDFELKRKK